MKLMREEVLAESGCLIDFGSCVLHVADNAFEKGLDKLSVDIPELVKALHGFFKKSTIRREQFADDLIDLDLPVLNFLRHVDTRWLSLLPAAVRVDKNWEAIEIYFLRTLPELASSGDTNEKRNAKDGMETKNYEKIVKQLEKSHCRATLKHVIFISEKFSPFLHVLQSAAPLIHRLYDDCVTLLLEVVSCFVKESKIPNTSSMLLKLDLSKDWSEVPLMSPSGKQCYKKLSNHAQASYNKEILECYKAIAEYLRNNLTPLDSNLVRRLRALNPENKTELKDGGNPYIVASAKELKKFSSAELDSLSLQWDALIQTPAYKEGKFDPKSDRIDEFYAKVLKELYKSRDPGHFDILDRFIKLSLSLPSSNAIIERGFSQSKMFLESRENLSLPTLIGLRNTKDAITHYGGSANVPITSSLRAAHMKAKSSYMKRLETERKDKNEHDQIIRAESLT